MSLNTQNSIFNFKEYEKILPNFLYKNISNNNELLILFVNPISGSQQGSIVLSLTDQYKNKEIKDFDIIFFPIPENQTENFLFSSYQSFDEKVSFASITFNIFDQNSLQKGYNFIKEYFDNFPNNNLKILLGGGDGTVLRIVEDLFKKNINLHKCIFGNIPMGTGNDLSNSMGFGSTVTLNYQIKQLQRVLYTYLIATEIKIDIWELEVKVEDNGKIIQITQNGPMIMYEENNNNNDNNNNKNENKKILKNWRKTFINYMSIGFDARVGYIFEKKRTASRLFNKVIYGWEAIRRYLCCKKIISLSEIIDSFQVPNSDNLFKKNINDPNNKGISSEFSESEIESSSNEKNKNIFLRDVNNEVVSFRKINLIGTHVNIICQNINFYMGGTENIWKSSEHLGIKIMKKLKTYDKYLKYKRRIFRKFKDQKPDDKKIEIFTYKSGFHMALERVSTGQAARVYQGIGPIYFLFKTHPSKKEIEALNKVYINADGEFFHLNQPLELSIRLNTDICDGQINFLKNKLLALDEEDDSINFFEFKISKKWVFISTILIILIAFCINRYLK
jgi:diacylglycerol kinase (ATP)